MHEEHLITHYAGSRLRLEALDPYLWRDTDFISVKKLWSYLTNYLYLPRLKNEQVLLDALHEAASGLLWNENFAYATGWDDTKQRFLGLKAGPRESITITLSNQSLLVKPELAQQQLDADEAAQRIAAIEKAGNQGVPRVGEITGTSNGSANADSSGVISPQPPKTVKRFHGSVKANPTRFVKDAGQIADEVIQHLLSLNADVEVTVEIQVRAPEGVPDNVIRTVTENCRVLKFSSHDFEEE